MAFTRRRVRLIGGDARPVEQLVRPRIAKTYRKGVGLEQPGRTVSHPGLSPERKAEIDARLQTEWDRQRDSGTLARKFLKQKKKKKKKRKKIS
jgi:hypothetical protein